MKYQNLDFTVKCLIYIPLEKCNESGLQFQQDLKYQERKNNLGVGGGKSLTIFYTEIYVNQFSPPWSSLSNT